MIFNGNKIVDQIYFGRNEVVQCYKGKELFWTPTEVPDEEAQFVPNEHHPTDSFFTDYYDFIGYLRVEPARYDGVRVHDEGTIQPYSPLGIIKRPFPLFGSERDYGAHLDDFRLTQDKEYIYDYSWSYEPYVYKYDVSLLNCQRGEYWKEGDYDINRLIGMQECCAGVEGIVVNGVQKSWTISKTNGTWDNSNKILSEIYFGDYTGLLYIGEYAFANSVNLRNIRFPQSCFVIMNNAFEGCTSLKTADFRNCVNLDDIRENAFKNCTSLEKIILPRLSNIDVTAFQGCSSLQSIVLLGPPPDVSIDVDRNKTSFVDVPNSLKIKINQEYQDAYENNPIWSHYVIEPYDEQDFVWEYQQ